VAEVDLRLTAMAMAGSVRSAPGPDHLCALYCPGRAVRVELIESHARWARARLLQVLETSPDRVAPPCPYFGPTNAAAATFSTSATKPRWSSNGRWSSTNWTA